MAATYTSELYRQENGVAAWRIISPNGQPIAEGIESDSDMLAILDEWNGTDHRYDQAPA
jgi:hypothetical protein